jgi:hypothetical protein
MDTCDGELIKRSGEIGDPPLIIGRPDLPHETSFEDMLADQNADRLGGVPPLPGTRYITGVLLG